MKNKNLIFVVLFSFVVSILGSRGSCHAARDKVIIAFGDSITEGFWEITSHTPGDRVGGYEPDLEALTDKINNHYDVLNYGLGGERTVSTEMHPYPEGGYTRLKDLVLPSQPNAEFCLIMEGTNDIWDGVPRATTVYTLGLMVERVREYGIEPILGTLTPDTRVAGDYKNVPAYNELIRELASEKKVVLADFYPAMIDEWDTKYASDDLLHPSREGFEKIAEIWFKVLSLPIRLPPAPWMILLLSKD